ncbi:MAG: alcohol dehydrogenase catalytic domain-containing protein [Bacillota bacterium]|jgi:L-iditol 2-dehydrogenase|nr:alcohol dehydrogenase catalytic domain-containing protein [Bacillota bacterium]
MKAAVYLGPGQLEVRKVAVPRVGPGEALLEVMYCGVCGTDVKTFVRGHHMFSPPCILGHEVVGRIVRLDSPAPGVAVREGDVVAVAPYVPCYSCAMCRRGRHELCECKDWIEGGFAEYVRIPAGVLLKGTVALPEGMPAELGCLSEPLACCINAVTDTPVRLGDTVLILGAGPMGLLMLEACKAAGAAKVLVSEPDAERREEAKRRGAVVADPAGCDLAACVSGVVGKAGPDQVFVCVGSAEAVSQGLTVAGKGSSVNVFGGLKSGTLLEVDAGRVHYDEVVLTGSFGFSPDQFKTALALLSSGRVDVENFITHVFSLDDAREALEAAAAGKVRKAVIAVNPDA